MAWVSKQNLDSKKPLIKELLKKWNLKGSLSGTNNSTMKLKITEGSLDFIGNHADVMDAKHHGRPSYAQTIEELRKKIAHNVNPYWYHEHFSGDCLQCLKEIMEVMQAGNHDNSDIQSDYFDVGWYVEIKIGNWNKPYVLNK